MLVRFAVEFAVFAQSRVVLVLGSVFECVTAAAAPNGLNVDLLCFCQAQGQLITVHLYFHRVAHGRQLDDRYLCSGDHAHI